MADQKQHKKIISAPEAHSLNLLMAFSRQWLVTIKFIEKVDDIVGAKLVNQTSPSKFGLT